MSPYLFVLAMEAFSRIITSRFEAGLIQYHPKTADLQISHLMFADNVMVFFDGSPNSLYGISECLDDFGSWPGLFMNKNKTELFHSGLLPTQALELSTYGFTQGSLPIRYLGLPLMSRKLRIDEYQPLLDKITNKFKAWSTKMLSFADRLQLIASVISGLVNFWISTFILPKGCIKQIESLCSRFLWSGDIDRLHTAKIAWNTVCLPKAEGGLGLRSFTTWNRVLCLRFIWLLLSDSPFLWTK